MRVKPEETDRPIPTYSSNWSERHVGYVMGLGTFGLSTDFISKVGACGRLISVVTDWDTEADEKDYKHWLDYCNRCGTCLKRCPADCYVPGGAKKDHKICRAHIERVCADRKPRYGCGKCMSGVPCATKPQRYKREDNIP